MRRVLVTGGAGFIGSSLVRQLISERVASVLTLDKLTYAGSLVPLASVMSEPTHTFVEGDVCDSSLLEQLFLDFKPTSVVHLAAESHVDRSISSPEAFLQSNVVGTFRLLAQSLKYWSGLAERDQGHFRFLHVSTDEVYGSIETGRSTEHSVYLPSSPYSASKAAADHFVHAFWRTYGLPVLQTHCSNNYGPFQYPEKLIPRMIGCAVNGEHLPIYGDGQQLRDWLFVEDHCRAILAVLERGRPGEIYNIGTGIESTNLDVARAICRIVDELVPSPTGPRSDLIRLVPDRPGHDRRYALCTAKIQSELGWRPVINFEDGLVQTVRWYLENQFDGQCPARAGLVNCVSPRVDGVQEVQL